MALLLLYLFAGCHGGICATKHSLNTMSRTVLPSSLLNFATVQQLFKLHALPNLQFAVSIHAMITHTILYI